MSYYVFSLVAEASPAARLTGSYLIQVYRLNNSELFELCERLHFSSGFVGKVKILEKRQVTPVVSQANHIFSSASESYVRFL